MITFLIIVLIILCILMTTAVLMQSSKGSGLIGPIGGSGVTTMFGARRTSDFLSKATIVMAVIFLLGSLLLNLYISKGGSGTSESIIQRNSGTQSYPKPNVPTEQQQPSGNQNNQGNPEGTQPPSNTP
ncbi:MAG: preprotein translocase subunit SecG [Ignavibacteriae bacterium]|jgi:preprotein translocase subunit SecG|nr:preprotein translocase subunit SecG [Ignavibacteriota bacterium]